jgi:ring-1,2-phenylacetyl-CoA epoxidase subunit PaaE
MFNFFKKKKQEKEEVSNKTNEKAAHSRYYHLKVKDVVRETSDSISIYFEQPENKIQYKAGQFLTLIMTINGEKIRRAYSLCTSPYLDESPGVTVKRVENGKMSNFLNDTIKTGDEIEVMEPMGAFTPVIDESLNRHLVLLGGGSGITPMMSIAKSVLLREKESKVSLIYANRDEDSIIFKSTLDQLEKENTGRFKVIHVLDNPKTDWEGPSGFLTPHSLKLLLNRLPDMGVDNTQYYMCGPEGFMHVVTVTLTELGIPKEFVHKESFVAGSSEKKEDKLDTDTSLEGKEVAQEVTIIHDGEEYKIKVEPGRSILQTALDMNIDLPFSCQSGVCTACRGKCISGKVRMDEEDGLSEQEIKDGYVLTCVGHPLTPDVVIEIG